MQKFFTPQVRIAIVVILAIVVLFFGIQFLRGISLFSNDVYYKIKSDDITGLSTSTPVYVRGFKVGIVRNIDYDYDKLGESITADVDAERTLRIPEGTTAEIVSDIMGDVKVVLQFGKSTKFLELNGWIDGDINDSTLGDLKSMVPFTQKMLSKLDSIPGSTNTFLTDPALQGSVHNADKIITNPTTSAREFDTLFAQANGSLPVMMAKAGRAMNNANGMMVSTSKGITEARGAIRGANTMMNNPNNRVNGLDIEAMMARVNAILDNMNSLTAKLNSNKGTMGLMLNGAPLYKNLDNTMCFVDSPLANLKAHPKRYAHFSISGRKDRQFKYGLNNIINASYAEKTP